jgi:cyclase
MNRKHFIRQTAFVTAGTLLFDMPAIASWFKKPAFKISMIRGDVGYFTESGGTIGFLLNNDGIIVVDAEFPEQAQHLVDELKKRSDKSFRLLLNTHHHRDHTAGNIVFKDLVTHVIAHENSAKNQKIVAEKNNYDKQLYPDVTFAEKWKIKIGDEKIHMDHFGPAHTNGDAVVHFQHTGVVHVGDLMFNRRHPVVDRTAGASITHWSEVLEKLVKKYDKDTVYIFGHAAEGRDVTGSASDLNAFREYLNRLMDYARSQVKAGITKEVFIKASLPFTTEWTGNPERTLTAAYEEAME